MLIGLCSEAGVGKSTLAKALAKKLETQTGIDATVYSFAKALRDEIYEQAQVTPIDKIGEIFPTMPQIVREGFVLVIVDSDCLWAKPTSPPIRALLQWWGTDYRRKQDPTYWLKMWAMNYPTGGHVIVDDVRFANEANLINLFGGYMVRLSRAGATDIAPAHASEEINKWWNPSRGISLILDEGSVYVQNNNATKLLKVMNAIGWS